MSDTAIVEQPTPETPAAPPETPQSEPLSLRQHAEKFGHDKGKLAPVVETRGATREGDTPAETSSESEAARVRARDESGRFAKADEAPKADDKKLHAKKDIARPEDVPRIRELTAKYRNEERLRLAAEAELAKYRSQPAPSSSQPVASPLQQTITQPDLTRGPLTDAEFYQTYPEATVGDFINYQVSYRLAANQAQQTQQANQTQLDQFVEQAQTAHQSRIEAYAKAHPEYDEVIAQAADVPTTPIVNWAVALHPRSPEVVLHLARHPELAYQLALNTRNQQVTDDAVAWTQRLFDSWLAPAPSTASGQPARHPVAPPPPNAVRTGPIKTGDGPPADGAGIRAHAQYFGYDKRR